LDVGAGGAATLAMGGVPADAAGPDVEEPPLTQQQTEDEEESDDDIVRLVAPRLVLETDSCLPSGLRFVRLTALLSGFWTLSFFHAVSLAHASSSMNI
jgi:hypothetical protein